MSYILEYTSGQKLRQRTRRDLLKGKLIHAMVEHIGRITWDNVIFYGEYVLDRSLELEDPGFDWTEAVLPCSRSSGSDCSMGRPRSGSWIGCSCCARSRISRRFPF